MEEKTFNCPYCNATGTTDSSQYRSGCCKATGKMTLDRIVQMEMGDVMLSVFEPREYERIMVRTYQEVCKKYNEQPVKVFEPFDFSTQDYPDHEDDWFDYNLQVLAHYASQFKAEDCKIWYV